MCMGVCACVWVCVSICLRSSLARWLRDRAPAIFLTALVTVQVSLPRTAGKRRHTRFICLAWTPYQLRMKKSPRALSTELQRAQQSKLVCLGSIYDWAGPGCWWKEPWRHFQLTALKQVESSGSTSQLFDWGKPRQVNMCHDHWRWTVKLWKGEGSSQSSAVAWKGALAGSPEWDPEGSGSGHASPAPH